MNRLIQRSINQDGAIYDVAFIYDDDSSPCLFCGTVSIHGIGVIKSVEYLEPNATTLSATLASFLGTYDAMRLLYEARIPKESLLWRLNHTGWADMSNEPLLSSD